MLEVVGGLRKYCLTPRTIGLSPTNPAISAVQIKQLNPDAITGWYWIKTSYMTAPVRIWCNMDWNGGGWMRLNNLVATLSSGKGSSPYWYAGDTTWLPDLVIGNNVGSGCGDNRAVVSVACNKLDYTEALVLFYRESTIIQCAGWTGETACGWHNGNYNAYAGSYTSNGMCLWNDGIWAVGTSVPISTAKRNWVAFCSFANQTTIAMTSQCSDSSDNGRYLSYYYVR